MATRTGTVCARGPSVQCRLPVLVVPPLHRQRLLAPGRRIARGRSKPSITAASREDVGTVELLHQAEQELQKLFESGKPQPTAKQVSDKRKKIKRLRDKLMQELVATFKDVSPETLADLGYGSGDNLTAVDKVRANLEAVAQESYVTMDEKEAMMELERENKVLRQRAESTLLRLQYLEDLRDRLIKEKSQGK